MNLGLQGKVAVVTGASKGIGLAITKMFVEEGAHVVAGARTIDGLAGLPGSRRASWTWPLRTDLLSWSRRRSRSMADSTCW
jgi:NAD(P)-dependent dehydrogenase (short-subunit alcohol dehydrogenase family)